MAEEPEEINAQPPWREEGYPSHLRQTAEALGFLIMLWGHLEGELNSIIIRMLKIDGVFYEIVGYIDFREKLHIIKSVAFSRIGDCAWFGRLESIINVIDNDLRVERNRMVHDMWVMDGNSELPLVRFGLTPKLRRPRSRQRTLERDIVAISADQIWNLCKRVIHTRQDLTDIIARAPVGASHGKS